MRWLVILTCLTFQLPAVAAQTYKIPLGILPNSATLTPPEGPQAPVEIPVSRFGFSGTCAGTFTAEIVDGGLELELDGSASNCNLSFRLVFTAQLAVPELGGTATMVRLGVESVESNFSALEIVRASPDPT